MRKNGNDLYFITVLRGVAAFVVFSGHCITFFPSVVSDPVDFYASPPLRKLLWPLLQGRDMVFLFVAISGYALYRNYFNDGDFRLKRYIVRRWNRIVPLYLVSLAIGLVSVKLATNSNATDGTGVSILTLSGFLSHLFFIQNWNTDWIFQINPPLWSVAVEVQLYLLLPIIYYSFKKLNKAYVLLLLPFFVRLIQSKIFDGLK
jgi:peptidoglycan/LPS O-acetylase OafA/YrhL